MHHFQAVVALGVVAGFKGFALISAYDYVSVLNAAVYIPLIPVIAMILARILGWEQPLNWHQVAGAFLGILGALLVTIISYRDQSSQSGAWNIVIGNIFLLVWVTGAAVGIVCQRPLLKHHSPIRLTAYINTMAGIFVAIVTPFFVPVASEWNLSAFAWGSVAFSASFNLLHGWADAVGVTVLPPSTVALFLILEPVFTDVISYLTGGGSVSALEITCAGLTCTGLIVVLYYTKARPNKGVSESSPFLAASLSEESGTGPTK